MITDGDFTSPVQNGARQVSLPLQQDQEYYCTAIQRSYQQLASNFTNTLFVRYAFTNFLLYSDDLTQSAWTTTNATPYYGNVDPEGGFSSSFLAETTDTGEHKAVQVLTVPPGHLRLGVCVKAVRPYVKLTLSNDTDGELVSTVFDVNFGVVFSGPGKIRRLADGWFYCEVDADATVANSTVSIAIGDPFTSFNYTGELGNGLFIWRATCAQNGVNQPVILTTASTRTVVTPPVDDDDPLAFFVQEDPPDTSTLEMGVAQWSRTYARVSRRTTVPSSVIVSKPNFQNSGQYVQADTYFAYQPDPEQQRWDIYDSFGVTSDSGAPSFYPTSGYYTLSILGVTSATIAYNASASAVQTAINAMAPFSDLGSVTVTGAWNTSTGFQIALDRLDNHIGWTPSLSAYYAAAFNYPHSVGFTGLEVTSGTYTIQVFGESTSALPYNSNYTAINSAVSALSVNSTYPGLISVSTRSGFNPVTNTLGFSIIVNLDLFTADTTHLSPGDAAISFSDISSSFPIYVGQYTQQMVLGSGGSRLIVAPGNDIGAGDEIFVQASYVSATSPATAYTSTHYVPITDFRVLTGDSIQLRGPASLPWMVAATISRVGRKIIEGYVPGPRNARCKKMTDYYLPGFTPGINTADDIPVLQPQNDGADFFDALIAGVPFNYVVGEIGIWKGPILYQSITTVKPVDLVNYIGPEFGVSLAGTGSGRVTSSPVGIDTTTAQGTRDFTPGETIILSAVPDAGSTFVGWAGTTQGQDESSATIVLVAGGSVNIVAVFDAAVDDDFTVTVVRAGNVTSSPAGINVTATGAGTNSQTHSGFGTQSITLTATGTITTDFYQWSGDTQGQDINNPVITVTSGSVLNITATFIPKDF